MTENVAPTSAPAEPAPSPAPEAPAPDAPSESAASALSKAFDAVGFEDDGLSALDRAAKMDVAPAEPEAQPESAERDERGRFKSKEAQETPQEAPQAAEEAEADPKAPKEASPVSEAPGGFSEPGREAWKDTPEPVRKDVERRLREMESGIEAYRADWGDLKDFAARAKAAGTTPKDVVDRYTAIDNLLTENPVQGLRWLAGKYGLDLGRLAGQPEPAPEGQRPQQDPALLREIADLRGQLAQVAQSQQAFTEAQRQAQKEAAASLQVQEFMAQKGRERFSELEGAISEILTSGQAGTLEAAYDLAAYRNPAPVQAVQTAPPPPPPATVNGAPGPGSNPARPISQTTSAALADAFARVGL